MVTTPRGNVPAGQKCAKWERRERQSEFVLRNTGKHSGVQSKAYQKATLLHDVTRKKADWHCRREGAEAHKPSTQALSHASDYNRSRPSYVGDGSKSLEWRVANARAKDKARKLIGKGVAGWYDHRNTPAYRARRAADEAAARQAAADRLTARNQDTAAMAKYRKRLGQVPPRAAGNPQTYI